MEQTLNLTINRLPALTWHHLGMNQTSLEQVLACRFSPCPAEAGWMSATGSSPPFHLRMLSESSNRRNGICRL